MSIFALNSRWPERAHPESEQLRGDVIYAGDYSAAKRVSALLKLFFRDPGKLFALVGICFRYLRTDLIAGLRAFRKLPLTAVFASRSKALGVKHLHAHFAYVTADTAKMIARCLGGTYSVSAHAWDIYTQKIRILKERLEGAEFIAVCTEEGQAYLERVARGSLAKKIRLIRHGIPLPAIEAREKGAEPVVVAVGRLVEKKGLEVLVRSHRILKERGVVLTCVIAGEGPLRKQLEAAVSENGLAGDTVFRGELFSNEVTALLKEATLLVHPSIVTETGDRDGLPNVVLEAMAMGIPVVATDASAAGEVVVDGVNGYVVPSGNETLLADRIGELVADGDLCERVGSEGRATVASAFDSGRNIKALVSGFQRESRDV